MALAISNRFPIEPCRQSMRGRVTSVRIIDAVLDDIPAYCLLNSEIA
jgi:hypothetical protein